MKDLRVRLGFILALALLPLLIFTIWRSYEDYKRDQALVYQNADLAARMALSDIVDTFESTQSVLTFASTVLAGETCETDFRRMIREYSHLHNIMMVDASGKVICSAKEVRTSAEENIGVLKRLTPQEPFTNFVFEFPQTSGGPEKVFATVYGTFRGEELLYALAAVEDLNSVDDLLAESHFLEGSESAIFSPSGTLLVGEWSLGDLKDLAASLPERRFTNRIRLKDKTGQEFLVTPTAAEQIFLAVSVPDRGLLDSAKFNPISSGLVPLLAWIFGFAAIWLSTDQLILIHLRRMRAATLAFAKGNRDMRVGKLNNPPASIGALGKNFDMMADRIGEREATIRDALKEKETLLREIHHRVKNNLQIIISLLNMQERKLKDELGLAAIVETRSRINAIALVHRGLYESEDLRYVNMQTFLDRLIPELAIAFGLKKRGIEVIMNADCELMEADTATPVALFIVEAMTNSVKHGVNRGGEISIRLTQEGEQVNVCVSDNGTSLPKASKPVDGTGTKLIKGFARQLGGKLEVDNDGDGYAVTLKFVPREVSSP